MTTITTNKTPHSEQLHIEADFSRHIASMKLAQETGQGRTVGLTIAKASLDEKEAKPAKDNEKLSTTDTFYRRLYQGMPEDKKAAALLSMFHDESNSVRKTLKTIGFKGLEIETFDKRTNPRAFNLSLCK